MTFEPFAENKINVFKEVARHGKYITQSFTRNVYLTGFHVCKVYRLSPQLTSNDLLTSTKQLREHLLVSSLIRTTAETLPTQEGLIYP